MKLSYISSKIENISTETLVFFTSGYSKVLNKDLKNLDSATNGAITKLLEAEQFSGKASEMAEFLSPAGLDFDRIILVGLGDKKSITADCFRNACGNLSKFKGLINSKKAVFYFDGFTDKHYFQASLEGYLLGGFKLLDYKTGDDAVSKVKLKEITFATSDSKIRRKMESAVEKGLIIAEGQCLVREFSETPGNYLTPTIFAQKAQKLSRKYGLSCSILDKKNIEKEKMGALLGVSQGSAQSPKFIIMKYNGGRKGQDPIVLVGKGVTFDSGGISLKPSLNMDEMKGDMTGAAVVISTIVTAARLKLPVNIVSLVPATENMPSGTATKPGDIHTSRKGLTIEIINTDAEGRLILADALDYANEFNPQAVIDIATLTGATLYSLGYEGAPIFSNNRKMIKMLNDASTETSERVWEFPLWQEYGEAMKSDIADLVNSGGRDAGTIKAAAFLQNFIGDYPWAHIDIAYVDVEKKGRPYIPKGTTGIGLRLLVEMLSNWKKPGK